MNLSQATALVKEHDAYVRSVYRKPRAELARLYRSELAAQGIELLYGGPASKDELTNAIVDLRYPLAVMNEAREVYYKALYPAPVSA